MEASAQQRGLEKANKCWCGRSNNGQCQGWHALTEEDYIVMVNEKIKGTMETKDGLG